MVHHTVEQIGVKINSPCRIILNLDQFPEKLTRLTVCFSQHNREFSENVKMNDWNLLLK